MRILDPWFSLKSVGLKHAFEVVFVYQLRVLIRGYCDLVQRFASACQFYGHVTGALIE